jgi:hypothetical protein
MLVAIPWYTVFEDDNGAGGDDKGGGDGTGDDKDGDGEGDDKNKDDKNKGGDKNKKLFTQDEVNKIMAENKRALQSRNEQLIQDLEKMKKAGNLTVEQKVQLEGRIETLQNELLSKEELSKKEADKLRKEADKIKESLTNERDEWKNRYTAATIQRTITDAAVENNAINPRQIVALLQTKANLVPETDNEGNATGNLVPKVKFDTSDKDGKPVTIEITIPEAVKQMKDMDEYFNLFKGEGTGGLGASSKSTGRAADARTLAKDPAKYREARKAGKI